MNNQTMILSWMKESLDAFVSELRLSKSHPTVEAYKYDVGRFLEYLMSRQVKKLANVKPVYIVQYLGYCKEGGKSDASINRYYMAIRAYCRYLRRSKCVSCDLTEDIAAPKMSLKAPRIPTLEEIKSILSKPNIGTMQGMRDRAMLELLYSSGLRASELCCLELHHIGPNNVMVSCGKRSKTRTIPLTEEAFNWIDKYIVAYRKNERGPLFQTITGRQIKRQQLNFIVSSYAKKAGVEGVTTHTLRHACATHLLDQGADIRLIQEVLGHSSIASTQRYTHLSSNKMQEMFKQFHPRKVTHE